MEDLRREGKIRAIGVSNFSPAQMRMFSADAQLDAVQPPYTPPATHQIAEYQLNGYFEMVEARLPQPRREGAP